MAGMKQERIEFADTRDRGISAEEIREGLERTRREKAQPGYAAREAARIAEVERRAKGRGVRFPELAGTKPTAPTRESFAQLFDIIR